MKFSWQKTIPSLARQSVPEADWSSWQWQLRHSLRTKKDFSQHFVLSQNEEHAFEQMGELFQIQTTPYYVSLASAQDLADPLRLIQLPNCQELKLGAQQMLDPLAEHKNQVAPRLIHRYSDRVLFLVTDFCSVYCRFCTRKRFTGKEQAWLSPSEYAEVLKYIQTHPGIREVILSGGDPLTLSDDRLEMVISDLRKIEHVEVIRLGTRMPVVCPMRITDLLVQRLKKYHPIFVMTHFNHPREITAESALALTKLVEHGFPVMNQMVLLNGVNNHPAIVQALSRRLLYLRVKPYYMFQCDPSEGTDHLRTSIENSLEIQKELWGHLSGLAMPTFAVDIPSGGGKTVHAPNFLIEQKDHARTYQGWDGVRADYVSPAAESMVSPADAQEYIAEWEQLKNAKLNLA